MRTFVLVLVLCLGVSSLSAAPAVPLGLGQEGEDPPVLLVPAKERDETAQDQLVAASMFTHGRLLFQREEYAAALQRYQRAYRYDPAAVAILGEIVSLAFQLEHNEEAARYAVIAAENDPQDPQLLRRLAMHLTEQEDFARAAKLYQKSFELQKDADDVTAILLHMEIGRLQFLQEEYDAAATSLTRVRDAIVDPKKFGLSDELYKIILGNAHATYTLLGECFLQAGRFEDAEAMFGKANEAKADPATLAFHLARIRAKQTQTDAALEQLESYFKAKGSAAGVEPYQLLLSLLTAKHGDDKAQTEYRQRLESLYAEDSGNVALAYAWGQALHDHGEDERAGEILAKSLEKDVTAEASSLLVEILHKQDKPDALLTVLGNSLGKTASIAALGKPGEALVADQKAIERLVEEARQRKSAEPSKLTPGEALSVALLAMQAKSYDAGDEFFAIVVENPPVAKTPLPKAEIVITWGLELLQAEQHERAAKVFEQALEKKLAPQREDLVRYFLSSAYELQGQTDKALATIEQTLQGSKPAARMLGRKAWIQYHAKRYADSEKTYRELLAKWDSDHKTNGNRDAMREARMILSNIAVQTDRRHEAMEWLEQVLDEFPEDVGAMNDLGYLWAEDSLHLNRSLRMLQTAVAAEPENHAYRDSLGWAYYQLRRYPEAVVELQKAAEVEEPDGVILDHLGDAYLGAGELSQAQDAWRRAAEAFEKEQDATRLKATRDKISKHTSK